MKIEIMMRFQADVPDDLDLEKAQVNVDEMSISKDAATKNALDDVFWTDEEMVSIRKILKEGG